MSDPSADSLHLELEIPDTVSAGDPVPVTLRARNTTERTLTLYLTGRDIVFDVTVQRDEGSDVWRRLEGEVVQAILRLETLPPGEALVLEATWNQRSNAGEPVPPGDYTVTAEIPTEVNRLVFPPASLVIVDDSPGHR